MICGGVGTLYMTNNESGAPYYLGGFLVGGLVCYQIYHKTIHINEPRHEIFNNVVRVCATSKGSDQPAHMRSLIRAFASRLTIL